jgi:hypothetical protein
MAEAKDRYLLLCVGGLEELVRRDVLDTLGGK